MKLESQRLDKEWLSIKGLNLQAVFQISDLPEDILNALREITSLENYRQLILLGHGGKELWNQVKETVEDVNEPIDEFSKQVVKELFQKQSSNNNYEIIYPSENSRAIGLQTLGGLAGWHFTSPFRVGINDQWGSWFAYRAVVLANSNFEPTEIENWVSPCIECETQECIEVCPADAISFEDILLNQCLDYRMEEKSSCSDRCLARIACPIAKEHQYTLEQIQYHYGRSFKTLLRFRS
ncbi:MAG: hypothetical protein OQJ89_13845 [Kangiellaceae bacterium]|nr:hypothetical protein [Kangiellaceae bacterium]MCW9018048.1 hypothetical protein [Kangiellaceae bacterium]